MDGGRDNWRSQFVLNSTGIFFNEQAREEQALRALLQESVVPLVKLRRLVLRYGVPEDQRTTVWKLLFGLIPPVRSAWDTAEASLKQAFSDLADVANDVFPMATETRVSKLTHVYGVHSGVSERGSLAATEAGLAGIQEDRRLHAMATAICNIFNEDDQSGAFWCLVEVVKSQRVVAKSKYGERRLQSWGIRHRIGLMDEILQVREKELVTLLGGMGIFTEKYAGTWFRSYFAESLDLDVIAPIWDRVIAAPGDIVVHIGVALLSCLKTAELSAAVASHNDQLALNFLRRPPPLSRERWRALLSGVAADCANLIDDESGLHDTIFTFDIEWPTVVKDDRGDIVKCLQYLLRAHGFAGLFSVDSVFGKRTEQALERLRTQLVERRAIQTTETRISGSSFGSSPPDNLVESYSSVSGIRQSGVSLEVEPNLDKEWTAGATLWPHLVQTVSQGSRGYVVRALQHLLLHRHGYKNVRVDSFFGTQTDQAVRHFQQHLAKRTIPVDGRVGRITWMHLLASDHYSRREA